MKKKFPKIGEYLDALGKIGKINSIYVRSFREVLKVIIPMGQLIDSLTFGLTENRALEKRLDHLECLCEKALKMNDVSQLVLQTTSINVALFSIMLHDPEHFPAENKEIRNILNTQVPIPKNRSKQFRVNPSFYLITISGAPGTGKDILLDLLYKDYFPNRDRCELLTKFTTRKKRPTDSRYYEHLKKRDFEREKNAGKILFPYTKIKNQYGFDKEHLEAKIPTPSILFCVFTEFHMLPRAREFLNAIGINIISILFECPEEHLMNRMWNRLLPEDEVKLRLDTVKQDMAYIQKNREQIENMFEHIIYNGDDRAKLDTYDELQKIILKYCI